MWVSRCMCAGALLLLSVLKQAHLSSSKGMAASRLPANKSYARLTLSTVRAFTVFPSIGMSAAMIALGALLFLTAHALLSAVRGPTCHQQ